MSLASLAGGLVTLFVFQRGLPHVAWIIGYLLLMWLLVVMLAVFGGLLVLGKGSAVAPFIYTLF